MKFYKHLFFFIDVMFQVLFSTCSCKTRFACVELCPRKCELVENTRAMKTVDEFVWKPLRRAAIQKSGSSLGRITHIFERQGEFFIIASSEALSIWFLPENLQTLQMWMMTPQCDETETFLRNSTRWSKQAGKPLGHSWGGGEQSYFTSLIF